MNASVLEIRFGLINLLKKKLFFAKFKTFIIQRLFSKKQCVTCPSNWVEFENSCYFISGSIKTWNDAKTDCEQKKSRLFVANTRTVIDFTAKFYTMNSLNGSYLVIKNQTLIKSQNEINSDHIWENY